MRTGFMIGAPQRIATFAKAAEDTYISPGFLRLPFCALTPPEIDEGIRRLADRVRATRT